MPEMVAHRSSPLSTFLDALRIIEIDGSVGVFVLIEMHIIGRFRLIEFPCMSIASLWPPLSLFCSAESVSSLLGPLASSFISVLLLISKSDSEFGGPMPAIVCVCARARVCVCPKEFRFDVGYCLRIIRPV